MKSSFNNSDIQRHSEFYSQTFLLQKIFNSFNIIQCTEATENLCVPKSMSRTNHCAPEQFRPSAKKRKLKTIGYGLCARINNSGGRRRRNTRNISSKSRRPRRCVVLCDPVIRKRESIRTRASRDPNPGKLVSRGLKSRIVNARIDKPARLGQR